MSIARQPEPRTNLERWLVDHAGLLAAIAALIVIMLLPTPAGLPVAGQQMLAILAFAVIVWMTEALDYAVSAVVIAALMAFLLGLSPNPSNPSVLMGTSAALSLAFSGFANTALALVASALFLAAAMTATGLDKRIALVILVARRHRHTSRGHRCDSGRLRHGLPGALDDRARGRLVPITLGIIAAFGVNRKSAFAGMLMITTAQTASIWNVGIKTAAAQNMVAIGFIERTFLRPSRGSNGSMAAAPFAILMSIALYFVMTRMMPPEVNEVPGGREAIRQSLDRTWPHEDIRKEASGDLADVAGASGPPKASCTASTPPRRPSPRLP